MKDLNTPIKLEGKNFKSLASIDLKAVFSKPCIIVKAQICTGGNVGVIIIKNDDDYRLTVSSIEKAPVGTDNSPINTHR